MIRPTVDDVLRSVIAAIEDEIAPTTDEYTASLCRTSAQMLRHVAARLREETPALVADAEDLRAVLSGVAPAVPELEPAIREAVDSLPAPRYPSIDELQHYCLHLRGLLVEVIESSPDAQGAPRAAARAYLARQLQRELPWQQDAYTGPRR
jgi:hypothetical protein